jgi:hypothetical protein
MEALHEKDEAMMLWLNASCALDCVCELRRFVEEQPFVTIVQGRLEMLHDDMSKRDLAGALDALTAGRRVARALDIAREEWALHFEVRRIEARYQVRDMLTGAEPGLGDRRRRAAEVAYLAAGPEAAERLLGVAEARQKAREERALQRTQRELVMKTSFAVAYGVKPAKLAEIVKKPPPRGSKKPGGNP